jgi:hypothetical protein
MAVQVRHAMTLRRLAAAVKLTSTHLAAIEDVHPQCGRELCVLACVSMGGTEEPGRPSGGGLPVLWFASPPAGGSGSA